MGTIETPNTIDQVIKISVKEFFGLCIFLLSLGVSIGGFIKVISEIDRLSSKIEEVSASVVDLKIMNAELNTTIKLREENKFVNSK